MALGPRQKWKCSTCIPCSKGVCTAFFPSLSFLMAKTKKPKAMTSHRLWDGWFWPQSVQHPRAQPAMGKAQLGGRGGVKATTAVDPVEERSSLPPRQRPASGQQRRSGAHTHIRQGAWAHTLELREGNSRRRKLWLNFREVGQQPGKGKGAVAHKRSPENWTRALEIWA